MTLEAKLKVIREKLDEGGKDFPNEAAVSQGIVLPILQELNWDTDNTSRVRPQLTTVGKDRADFALYDKSGNRKVFIEVKRLGGVAENAEKAEEQIMRYAHSKDNKARIAVLTDGGTWSLYLPEEGGLGYKGKRVFKLNILEQPTQESSEVLQRYLEESRVVYDKALETARVSLFLEKDEQLDNLKWMVDAAIASFKRVFDNLAIELNRVKPKPAQGNIDHGIVDHFLSLLRQEISLSSSDTTAQRAQLELGGQVPTQLSSGASKRKQPAPRRGRRVSPPPEPEARPVRRSNVHFNEPPVALNVVPRAPNVLIKKIIILGRRYSGRNQSKAIALVFKELQKVDDRFLKLFYKHPENQRKGGRRYLGRNLQELFGNNVEGKSKESVGRDWIISTNYGWEVAGRSKSSKKRIIQLAAEVAGLKLKLEEDISGKGIIVNLER